jgi:hypothetical protein
LPANLPVLLSWLEFANRTRQVKSRALMYRMIASATAIHFADQLAAMLASLFRCFVSDRFAALIDPRSAGTMQRPDADLDFVGSLA